MFGSSAPQNMPRHFFSPCIDLDFDSAIRANVENQNFSVAPRHWYVDATVRCNRCGDAFCFSAVEQRTWYEEYGFYVDSFPKHCPTCRKDRRILRALRQEYDRDIAAALSSNDRELKLRMIDVVEQLLAAGEDLQTKIHENRRLLSHHQVARNQ